MILARDGQRLSKRHGAVGVMQYRDDGYLPQALLNYLIRLGWSHGDQEIFSRQEMTSLFDVVNVNRAAAAFDNEKLQWLNQHYIKASAADVLADTLGQQLRCLGLDTANGPALSKVVSAQQERAKTMAEMAENSVYFYQDFEEFEEKAAKKNFKPDAEGPLRRLRQQFESLQDWRAEAIHEIVVRTAEEADVKLGKVAQPLRVAVSGRGFSPPIDVTLELVGRERTLTRIDRALDYIKDIGTSY